MTLKACVTVNITFKEIRKAKEIIIPFVQQLRLEDFFYLFYDSRLKVGLVGVTRKEVEPSLSKLKDSSRIVDYEFVPDESILDINKIMACAARRISEFLSLKISYLDIDALVEELAPLPEINADAYSPLHFVLNQLRLLPSEAEIRLRLKMHPKYIEGYKKLPTGYILLR